MTTYHEAMQELLNDNKGLLNKVNADALQKVIDKGLAMEGDPGISTMKARKDAMEKFLDTFPDKPNDNEKKFGELLISLIAKNHTYDKPKKLEKFMQDPGLIAKTALKAIGCNSVQQAFSNAANDATTKLSEKCGLTYSGPSSRQ
jgi:hypothetical protein